MKHRRPLVLMSALLGLNFLSIAIFLLLRSPRAARFIGIDLPPHHSWWLFPAFFIVQGVIGVSMAGLGWKIAIDQVKKDRLERYKRVNDRPGQRRD